MFLRFKPVPESVPPILIESPSLEPFLKVFGFLLVETAQLNLVGNPNKIIKIKKTGYFKFDFSRTFKFNLFSRKMQRKSISCLKYFKKITFFVKIKECILLQKQMALEMIL